ncbi:hypothetical protein [Rhodococcus sovatensis]|uniref:Head-tail adaptor protein n=1 Tax=Rhodococcus sovatensis TaxID=1805840 RepID=A0ABZ2PWG9_9NOCA
MPRLLLRDTVTLKIGGGMDENDDPIPAQNLPVRAEVIPISGDEQAARGRMMTSVEYRLLVADKRIETVTQATWRGLVYTFQGKVMAYRIGGRVHHYEVVMRTGTG